MSTPTIHIIFNGYTTSENSKDYYNYSSHTYSYKYESIPNTETTKQKRQTVVKVVATEEDLKKYNIPSDYNTKHWNALLPPIVFLTNVYDSESLIKWIHDWQVFHDKEDVYNISLCRDIQTGFADLNKRVIKSISRLKYSIDDDTKETLVDFIVASGRITYKLQKVVDTVAKGIEASIDIRSLEGKSRSKYIGKLCLTIIFGEYKELQIMESILNSINTWIFRFDANVV